LWITLINQLKHTGTRGKLVTNMEDSAMKDNSVKLKAWEL